jgi:zinc protease
MGLSRAVVMATVSACLAILAFVLVQPAQALERLVRDRVFLVPDPKAQSINFQMLVLAGCADEAGNDCKGIAHYLEHLVLVGRNAENRESAMRFFSDGNSNGYTTSRVTGYTHQFPAAAPDVADRLDRLFGFYAARLKGFEISPEDAVRERNVVMQEYNWRYGSSPYAATGREVSRFLYPDHPLGQPVIGSPELISAFSVEASRAFLERWYKLSNVYFILSGPVDEAQLRTIADRHLNGLEMSPPPAREWVRTPPRLAQEQRSFRHEDRRIAETTVTISRAIPFNDSDRLKTLAATLVLNEFLRSKLKGSPHSVLVEQDGIASGMRGASVRRFMDGVLTTSIGATPEPEISVERLTTAMQSYMDQLSERGLDEATVERLKRRFAQSYERSLADPQRAPGRLIDWLGENLPYERLKDTPAIVAAVTAADINALLKAQNTPGRQATVVFAPKVTQ